MSRRTLLLMLLPITLLLAACGGSKHSSSTASTASTSTTSSALSTSTTTASTATTSSRTSSGRRSTRTQTPRGSARGSQGDRSGGSTNVRVPATFVIRSGGKLNPPVVSVPSFLAVQLSVASGDGRSHRVLVKLTAPKTLSVPANGRRTILIPGLRAGRYEIDVDGKPGGALMIGGAPGP